MFVEADAELAFAESADAGEQKANEVHGVFPFDLAVSAKVLLELFELAHDVAVVGLVNEPGEETLASGQEFLRERRGVFDEGRVEAFEDVRVGFERHDEKFLKLPIRFLRGVVLDLFGHAVERPMQVGGRQVNAAAIDVGRIIAEAERLRADDASINDERFPKVEVGAGFDGVAADGFVGFEFLEDGKFAAAEHGFGVVVEADFIGVFGIGRRFKDACHSTGGNEAAAADRVRVVARDDPRAGREDEMDGVAHGDVADMRKSE